MHTVRLHGSTMLLPLLLLLGTVQASQDADRYTPAVIFRNVHARINEIRDTMVPPSMYREAMFHVMSYYAPLDANSELCRNHSVLYLESFINDTIWAAKMFDASSKIGDGVSHGHLIGLGAYDACLDVSVPGKFQGQYCLVELSGVLDSLFQASKITEYTLFAGFNLDFAFSLCVPSTCSFEDVRTHINAGLTDINASGIVNERSCSLKEPKRLRVSDWVAIYVLIVIAGLVVLSTAFDCYVCHQPSKTFRILTAFSVISNTNKLLYINSSSSSLSVIYFLRFFAIVWIVSGHRFDIGLAAPSLDLTVSEKYLTIWWMAPLLDVNIAVEIFFLLSGLLVAFNFLKARTSSQQFSIWHYYGHRYLRLTPSLALIVLLEATLMYQVSEGPIWKRLVGACMDKCASNWWSTILYISNYIHPYSTCMLQSWYLCVDMQLYLLSPLLLFPLHKNPAKGLKIISACLVATIVAAFCNAMYFGLHAGSNVTVDKKTEQNHGSEYVKTHVRAASWLMGLILGYIVFEFKHKGRKFSIPKAIVVLAWIASTLLWLAVVFTVTIFQEQTYEYSPIVDSLYIALSRPLFSLGFAWLIFACVTGYGGPINTVLSWPAFQPLGTLSYGIYLTHLALQVMDVGRILVPYQYDGYILVTKAMSDVIQATICAYLLYIAVEGPCAEIDRWIFFKAKSCQHTGCTTGAQWSLAVSILKLKTTVVCSDILIIVTRNF